MRLSILIFLGLILAFELISSEESICTGEKITCHCGANGTTVSICSTGDQYEHENVCAAYRHCESCEDDVTHCITCPRGYSGPFCDHEDGSGAWNENSDTGETRSRRVSRGVSCRNIRAPKLGSVRCWHQGYETECTGECLPGHSFESGVKEIKLACESGVWYPRSSFPPCISQGYCKIKITEAGYYNCTTGVGGTYCDITCNGHRYRPTFGRFHCYPGDSWDPPLPRCAQDTAAEEERTGSNRPRSCKCQNGGSCTSWSRDCQCLPGYSGTFCEIRENDRRTQCRSPPQIDNGEAENTDGSAVRQDQRFYEGSSVVYSCHTNYYLTGKSSLRCTEYGIWSDFPPKCMLLNPPKPGENDRRTQCRSPPQIDNGEAENTDGSAVRQDQRFYEGSSVVYSCHTNYYLTGKSSLRCTEYGIWSDFPPKCMLLNPPKPEPQTGTCPDPGQVANGIRRTLNERWSSHNQKFSLGNTVIFVCDDDFTLIGESMLRCTESGKWSSPVPVCRTRESPTTESIDFDSAYCKDPGVDPNGIKIISPWITPKESNQNPKEVEYPQGTEIAYSCEEGYDLQGDATLLCLFSGSWSALVPTCLRKVSSTSTTADEDLVYCKDPGVDPNGIRTVSLWIDAKRASSEHDVTEHPQGTKINYSCKEGYELEGDRAIICLFSGHWSSPTPKCRAKHSAAMREEYCENPGDISNGRKTVSQFIDPRTNRRSSERSSDFPKGVKIVFHCNNGFTIQGSETIECQTGGTWSGAIPTCEKERSRQIQGCGHSSVTVIGKMLHADRTVPGEWPWQVAYAENRVRGITITCGGTLINHNTVVTAAHCILPRRLGKTFLYFGKFHSDFSEDGNEVLSRKASSFAVHPMYDRITMDNDIALVRFEPEVPYNNFIQPICFPTQGTTSQNLQLGRKGWVTGWGTTENGTDSDILLKAHLPVVPTSRCREMYRRLNPPVLITNNMYCAGYIEGGADSCAGDSGGSMVFYNNATESYVVEGIVSFGVKGPNGSCGQKDRYGVYTKVSNYVSWIKRNT